MGFTCRNSLSLSSETADMFIATGSWVETGSYFETLIHRGKLHLTAVPLEGWKNDHLQICPPGLQRISTRVSGVPH